MKVKSIFLLVLVIITIASITACTSGNYEDKFLGEWISVSGNMTIMYSFEKDGDTYTAACMTQNGYDDNFYMFDKFSASDSVITFYQNGTTTKDYYSFEDGYLYIDNLEFEKID